MKKTERLNQEIDELSKIKKSINENEIIRL